jgi:hypothetical protein
VIRALSRREAAGTVPPYERGKDRIAPQEQAPRTRIVVRCHVGSIIQPVRRSPGARRLMRGWKEEAARLPSEMATDIASNAGVRPIRRLRTSLVRRERGALGLL